MISSTGCAVRVRSADSAATVLRALSDATLLACIWFDKALLVCTVMSKHLFHIPPACRTSATASRNVLSCWEVGVGMAGVADAGNGGIDSSVWWALLKYEYTQSEWMTGVIQLSFQKFIHLCALRFAQLLGHLVASQAS